VRLHGCACVRLFAVYHFSVCICFAILLSVRAADLIVPPMWICDPYRQNFTLQALDLHNNAIGAAGAAAISKGLQYARYRRVCCNFFPFCHSVSVFCFSLANSGRRNLMGVLELAQTCQLASIAFEWQLYW
jgi:hypothetical protein